MIAAWCSASFGYASSVVAVRAARASIPSVKEREVVVAQ